jgi:hypothetical protein
MARPLIPEGKVAPQFVEGSGVVLKDHGRISAFQVADAKLLLAGLELAWVLERNPATSDSEWQGEVEKFRSALAAPGYEGVFWVEASELPTEVTDGDVIRLSNALHVAFWGMAGALAWHISVRWSMTGASDDHELASIVHANGGVVHIKRLLAASRTIGLLLALSSVLAVLAANGYASANEIVTAASIEFAVVVGPWLLGPVALLVWVQQHGRIRRTWKGAQRLRQSRPLLG